MTYDRDGLLVQADGIVNTLSTLPEDTPPPPPPPPPPPTEGDDPVVVYDGVRGLSAIYLSWAWQPWRFKGGDWYDADGLPNGAKPFATVVAQTGQTADILLDVSSLARAGEDTFVLDAEPAMQSPSIAIASRETGRGPKLDVRYVDGSGEVLPVMYDTETSPSTLYELGQKPQFTITPAHAVYLRFPKTSKPVGAATLVLTPVTSVYRGGTIKLFKFALHRDPPSIETFTLNDDPRVFLRTVAFEEAWNDLQAHASRPVAQRADPLASAPLSGLGDHLFGYPHFNSSVDTYQQRAIVDTPEGKALQLTFDPAVNRLVSASILFPGGLEASEAAVEFDVRFLPSMLTGLNDGFKCAIGFSSSTKNDDATFAQRHGLPVGRCGTLLAGNGGARAHGYDGWSLRHDCMKSEPLPHPLHGRFGLHQYCYWPEQADYFGDAWFWHGQPMIPVGEKARVAIRAKVNDCVGTAYQKNAELDGYVNGRLAVRRRGFYLRTTDAPVIAQPPYNVQSKLAIGRFWLNGYHGGTSLPAARCSYQISNVAVARFA